MYFVKKLGAMLESGVLTLLCFNWLVDIDKSFNKPPFTSYFFNFANWTVIARAIQQAKLNKKMVKIVT